MVNRLELDRWHVVAVAVQALVIAPMRPSQRGQFEVVNVLPGTASGAAHQLGLVDGVDRFGEGVVKAATDRSERGNGADLGRTLAKSQRRELTRFNR